MGIGNSRAALVEALNGITVTAVTPFLPDSLALDLPGLRRNLGFLAESDVSVVVPAGNTGEFHSLTSDEVEEVTRETVAALRGRKPVLAGVGGPLVTAIALAQAAERAGAEGLLLHEPAHTFVSRQGLADYYRSICRSVTIGVAIYKRTSRLPDDLLLDLAAECANVVAIKYAWNDVAAYTTLVTRVPSHVVCACGSAERWALPFSAAGTTGFTSGIANFAPAASVAFWTALKVRGCVDDILALWRPFARFEDLRALNAGALNVPAIKFAMDQVGLAGGPVRPPLSAVDEAAAGQIRIMLGDFGVR